MNFGKYSKIVFLDANVVLEGRRLTDQPWHDIEATGSILLLFVPQVLREIDSKKRDGRLSKHARDFNRLIAPVAEKGTAFRLVDGPPMVDIALAETAIVDWEKLDDFDPNESDARIIAQVLNEKHTGFSDRLFISQDINPIAMASRHGLKVKRLPDSWLRQPEPNPDQRKINKLEERVRELQATEPQLEIDIAFSCSKPFEHLSVSELTSDQKHELKKSIIKKNPKISQNIGGAFTPLLSVDHEYSGKYDRWRTKTVSRFVESLSSHINRMFAQIPIKFEIRNTGAIQAESLVVHVKVVNGTISERWSVVPDFPPAPQLDPAGILRGISDYEWSRNLLQPNVGRHEMHFDIVADGSDTFEVHCQDFRHGRVWDFDAILTADPATTDDVVIVINMTASNMRGSKESVFKLSHSVKQQELSSIFDIENVMFIVDRPMEGKLRTLAEDHEFSQFDFLTYCDDS